MNLGTFRCHLATGDWLDRGDPSLSPVIWSPESSTMICVSIGRSRHKHMLAEHKHLCEQGAKLVELRLDYISSRVNIQRLVKDRPCPTIITVRREQDGGKFTGDEDARLRMLREAIALGVDYVDLEEDIAGDIPRFGKTKRIVSYHSFRNTPDNLRELHDRLKTKDPDIVKIATMANQPRDNVRVLEMMQESDVPTIGMCMGDVGTPSRILGPKFGAPFTYATFHHERALAPGQLSYQQMVEVYRHDSINPETAVYGVIADPIGHSLSPQVHNAAFGEAGIDAVYVPFRVPIDTLGQFMEDMPRLGLKGLSVTIPHKEAIAKFLTKVDPAVKGIGAVNTVLFKDHEVRRLQHRLQGRDGFARERVRHRRRDAQPAQGQTRARAGGRRRGAGGRCTASNAAAPSRPSPAAPARGPSTSPTSSAAGPSIGRPATTPKST